MWKTDVWAQEDGARTAGAAALTSTPGSEEEAAVSHGGPPPPPPPPPRALRRPRGEGRGQGARVYTDLIHTAYSRKRHCTVKQLCANKMNAWNLKKKKEHQRNTLGSKTPRAELQRSAVKSKTTGEARGLRKPRWGFPLPLWGEH